jgi:transcriptional regulator GlxA family with amidase domain
MTSSEPTRHIGILLFPDVEELDAIGPWEALAYWTRAFPEDGYSVSCLSRDGGPVTCSHGLTVLPQHSFADAPALDVLVHPGGHGTRPQLTDEAHLDWVRQQRGQASLLASVCTGSLVYAAAGLLAGRPATTHWSTLADLARLDGSIEVRPDDRFVDDGDIVTSAGISAGIDMALHLVGRLGSPEHARQVAHGMQYDAYQPTAVA